MEEKGVYIYKINLRNEQDVFLVVLYTVWHMAIHYDIR